MTQIVYVAHPLGGDVANNAKRARRWLRWLLDREPDYAFCIPWLPYVDVGDDDSPAVRARGLRDDCAIAALCHGIILTGPRISPGMIEEMRAVQRTGGWVADITCAIDPLVTPIIVAMRGFTKGPIEYGRARRVDL